MYSKFSQRKHELHQKLAAKTVRRIMFLIFAHTNIQLCIAHTIVEN